MAHLSSLRVEAPDFVLPPSSSVPPHVARGLLRADAPEFVLPASSNVPQHVASGLVTYLLRPEVLPPLGLVTAPCSLGPAPPPPPPPPPVFQGSWGFPQGPGVGLPGPFTQPAAWAAPMPVPVPMPHGAMAFPSPPAVVHFPAPPVGPPPAGFHGAPPQPQLVSITAAPQHGGYPPSRSARTGRANRARPQPRLDVPPRRQRAVGPVLPASRRVTKEASGQGGDAAAKREPANESSPRSVLVTTSPPVSPNSSLPETFPLPYVTSTAPPASTGLTPSAEPSPGTKLATGSPPVNPPQRRRRVRVRAPLPPQQASNGEVRRRFQKPRRLFDPASNLTSLMIRNIPNSFTRKRLMNIIDQHCAEENAKILSAGGGVLSEYDFLYLPMDFGTKANKGYAFVNVTSPAAACRLWEHLHGYRWQVKDCGKTCEIDYATVQGRDALVAHFSESCFDCETAEFLPVWFQPPRDGVRPAVGVQHVVGHLGRRS